MHLPILVRYDDMYLNYPNEAITCKSKLVWACKIVNDIIFYVWMNANSFCYLPRTGQYEAYYLLFSSVVITRSFRTKVRSFYQINIKSFKAKLISFLLNLSTMWKTIYLVAAIAPWFRLRLPFCGPRFKSKHTFYSFFQFVLLKL